MHQARNPICRANTSVLKHPPCTSLIKRWQQQQQQLLLILYYASRHVNAALQVLLCCRNGAIFLYLLASSTGFLCVPASPTGAYT